MANEGKKTFSLDVELKADVEKFISDNSLSHNDAMRLMLSAAKSQMLKLNESKRVNEISNVQNLAKQLIDCFVTAWTYNENAEGRIRVEFEDQISSLQTKLEEVESENADLIEEVNRLRTTFIAEVDKLKKDKDAEADNLKNELNSVTNKYDKLMKEHEQMSKLLASVEENKSRLESDVAKLKSADERVKDLEAEIESLKESRFEYAEKVRDKALVEVKEAHLQLVQAKDEQISSLKSIIETLKK